MLETLLSKLPLQGEVIVGEDYIFDDYTEFVKLYNFLDNSTIVSKNSPQSYLTENDCHLEFDGDDFIVIVEGDFDKDNYVIKITEG
jgi:hypothetical protein